MKKIITFIRYVKDYLKFGEYYFLWTSIQYVLFKKINPKQRIYKSSLGTFLTRKGTLDFQFANYAYEWSVKKFFLQNYQPYNVFLDIGSNIGTYCFLMAPKGLPCYAFEPVKENFEALMTNIRLNKLEDKIHPFPFGLGSEIMDADFIFEPMNTGASHLAKFHSYVENKGEIGQQEKVKIKTLDSLLDQLQLKKEDKVLLKIDAEGMELDIIKGGIKFISNQPEFLMIMEKSHSDFDKIQELFAQICKVSYQQIDEENVAIIKIL